MRTMYRCWWSQPLPYLEPASPREDMVRVTDLPREKQARLWQGLQRCDPELARLLREDPFYQALKRTFDASLVVTKSEYRRYMEGTCHEG